MKKVNWRVWPEYFDRTNKLRLDVVAYHDIFKEWFGFELKYPTSNKEYTLALRQLIEYRLGEWGVPIRLFCLIIPRVENTAYSIHEGPYSIHERYFWRFGLGFGNVDSMYVRFPDNGDAITTINLVNPTEAHYYSPEQKIETILRKVKNAWDSYDINES